MIEASPVFQALQARQTLDGSHVLLHEDQTREWMNTLFTTTAGFPPPQIRQGPVELSPQQGPTMLDVVPQVMAAEDSSYRYMLESTFATTNVAPKTEGSAAGEVRIAYTEQTAPIQWIPVTLPVTIQDLQDVAGLQFLLESRLRFMIEQELDKQILTGNGTAPNLTGTLNVTGIQTEAKASTEDIFDEIYKVFVDIMSDGQATPDTIVLNPNNWQTLRTKKDTDGNYLYGPPYLAGDLPVWGANKVITSHMTANTAAVGAYRQHSVLAIRGGVEIAVTDSHAAEFISGINRIRVSLRAAMVHRRPKAFGTITTLNT